MPGNMVTAETPAFELLTRQHNRRGFSCNEDSLTTYIRQHALRDADRRISACYVLRDRSSATADIIGYYTLSAQSLQLASLSPDEVRRLPRYPFVPVALLGRMAVDARWQGKGYGADLLADAVQRSRNSEIAVYALVVDAINDTAAAFYEHFGFHRIHQWSPAPEDSRRLYLPLRSIA